MIARHRLTLRGRRMAFKRKVFVIAHEHAPRFVCFGLCRAPISLPSIGIVRESIRHAHDIVATEQVTGSDEMGGGGGKLSVVQGIMMGSFTGRKDRSSGGYRTGQTNSRHSFRHMYKPGCTGGRGRNVSNADVGSGRYRRTGMSR